MTVERPLRIRGAAPDRAYRAAELKKLKEIGERSEDAPPVIRKIHKRGTAAGLYVSHGSIIPSKGRIL